MRVGADQPHQRRAGAQTRRAHTGTGVQVRYQTRGLSAILPLGR